MAHAQRAGSRRGFLIISVMVLLIIVVTVTSWMLASAVRRAGVVELRLETYRQHHELMSVRAIADQWISRQRDGALEELAGDPRLRDRPEPLVYDAQLPDGLRLRMTLARAQGTILRDTELADSVRMRETMEGVLERLALLGATEEATRAFGPAKFVLSDAPDALIEAVAGDDPATRAALLRAREEAINNPGEIQRELQNAGVEFDVAGRLAGELFAASTSLWRLTVYAQREGNRRVYRLYMHETGTPNVMSDWRIVGDEELRGRDLEGADAPELPPDWMGRDDPAQDGRLR